MGLPPIRGVAFDLEGTIIDVEAAHHEAHLASAADIGLHLELDEALENLPHFIGGPDEAVAHEIWTLSGRRSSPERILERKRAHYRKLVSAITVAPRPGFLGVCSWLKDHAYPVCVGSLTNRREAEWLMGAAGLNLVFGSGMVVVREDVAKLKPSPDVYIETARRMNIAPEEQLVFDDSAHGIAAACLAGSTAIGMPCVLRKDTSGSLFQAGASQVFWSWTEVNVASLVGHN